MEIMMIACIYNTAKSKDPIGFRMLDTGSGQIMDVTYQQLEKVVAAKSAKVTNVKLESGILKGANGSFSRYSKIVKGKLVGASKMVILKEIGDAGYEVCDHNGKTQKFTTADCIRYGESFGIANGKIVQRDDGTKFISSISGEYDEITIDEAKKQAKPKQQTIKQPEEVKNTTAKQPISTQNTSNQTKKNTSTIDTTASKDYQQRVREARLPSIRGTEVSIENTRMKNMCTDEEMTVEQKLARGYLVIQNIRSFYYAVLQTIKRKESTEIPTMAVSLDTLYFNSDFVAKLTLPQLIFVELHEVCHIAMKHNGRRGQRDPEMWNIACDLYINKTLCDEFGIAPGQDVKRVPEDKLNVGIQFVEGGLYDGTIDVLKTTPEAIYQQLEKESKVTQQSFGLQNQQNEQGQDQSGQGQSGSSQSGQQTGQSGSQSGQGQPGQQGQSQNSQGGQQVGQQAGQNQSGNGQGQSGNGQGQQSGQGGQDDSGPTITVTNKEYIFNGKTLITSQDMKVNGLSDIVDDEKSRTASDNTKKGLYDSIMKKAKVLEKQMRAGKGKGHYGVVETFVDDALVPKINWRTLLMNRLVAMKSDEKSLSTPDRRFIYSGTYMEGNREEDEMLRDIKVTIDTSGSMSDKDIAIAFAQIKQLLKTYKVDAEIVFWDDGIQDIIKFDDYNSLMLAKHRATGRGGTDPNCVFELFEGREYKLGLKPKPELIVMFTDGIFDGPDKKYKNKYGRDTIWVISREDGGASFKPPFGKVAKLRDD